MTNTSILSTIMSTFDGATMVRVGKTNFVAIPTGDPVQPYVKVAVGNLLAKDTENHSAFNFDEAASAYQNWSADQTTKANAPKKEKTVNTEAQARRDAMDAALIGWFEDVAEAEKQYTATDLLNLVPGFDQYTVMAVGSCAIRLANEGAIKMELNEKGKKMYSKC